MPSRILLAIILSLPIAPTRMIQADEPETSSKSAAEKKLGFDPYDQSNVPLEVKPPAGYQGKVIVLVAGSKSHGPGAHEFFAGTAILMDLLKQNNVWPIMARDGWPKDETIFDMADSVVFYMDGRQGHPVVQKDRMARMQKLIDKGIGWVNLHYAVDYLPKDGETVVKWMGGYYDPRISTNPHWDAEFRSLPNNPITRGVRPFTMNDEWYFNMHWIDDATKVANAQGVTPILQAVPPDDKRGTDDAKQYLGRLETVAWAYQRPDGGRAFGFTGGHFHRNWGSKDFRRLVVNAILWTANADVPDDGAKVEMKPIDLNRNLDDKGKKFEMIEPAK